MLKNLSRGRHITSNKAFIILLVVLISLFTVTFTANADRNLALNKTATQSSTRNGGEPARAVDGNTDGNWNNNSVTETKGETELPPPATPATPTGLRIIDDPGPNVTTSPRTGDINTDNQAWWKVDLGAEKLIHEIKIWNRTDCCASLLGRYTVSILNTAENVVWSNTQESYPDPSITIPTGSVKGRYVRVLLGYKDVSLSLAEVEVMGGDGIVANE